MTNRFVSSAVRRGHRPLSCRLDREWAHLCQRPAVLERVRSWHLTDLRFGSLAELLLMCGRDVEPSPGADELLRRLVEIAGDEPLAARIVLQRILPGLLAIVRREQTRDRRVDAFDLLVAEAWLSIICYRADVRRTNVAARLLNDARHRAFTSPRRRRHRTVEEIVAPRELDLPSMPSPGSAFDELMSVLGDARRAGLTDNDLAIVGEVLADESPHDLAAARNVTARTLRNHRHRAINRIKKLAA